MVSSVRRDGRLTIQIVRPSESNADPQVQVHPALLRLSVIISQSFTLGLHVCRCPHVKKGPNSDAIANCV